MVYEQLLVPSHNIRKIDKLADIHKLANICKFTLYHSISLFDHHIEKVLIALS